MAIKRGAKRTPSQVRNMMEVRVRKLSSTYGLEDQIDAADEMRTILDDFLAEREEMLHKVTGTATHDK